MSPRGKTRHLISGVMLVWRGADPRSVESLWGVVESCEDLWTSFLEQSIAMKSLHPSASKSVISPDAEEKLFISAPYFCSHSMATRTEGHRSPNCTLTQLYVVSKLCRASSVAGNLGLVAAYWNTEDNENIVSYIHVSYTCYPITYPFCFNSIPSWNKSNRVFKFVYTKSRAYVRRHVCVSSKSIRRFFSVLLISSTI